MRVQRIGIERFDEVVDVFCDAFRDYPVMRYVIGAAGADYDRRLAQLIGYFTEARFCRQYPVLGIESGGHLVATANVNPPRGVPAPDSLKRSYARLGETLGSPAIARYEAFAEACSPFDPQVPHYHLGMIGVRHAEQKRGHARRLLEAVHELSRADPESTGVSLTTENSRNVPLYEHFGYVVSGHAKTRDDGLETWALFRADS